MLPLPHNLSRNRPHSHKICQARHEHGQQRRQHVQPILRLKHSGKTGWSESSGCPFARVCQGEDDRESGLHGEVDGEDGLLEGGELGAGQSPVGYYASDE
jgi:hypothetical protein